MGTKYKAGKTLADARVVTMTADEDAARAAEIAANEAGQPDRDFLSLRLERNILLTESDWTQYADSPLGDEAKAEWVTYRESLRDLPENTDDPANPTWPTPPGG